MVYDCEVAILPCTRWVSDLRPPSGEDFLRSSGSNHSCSSVDTFSSQSPFVCAAMGWAPVQPSFGTFWYFCLQINKNPFLYLPWSIDPRKFTFQKNYILEKLHSRKFTYYQHVKSSWWSCWWRWGCSLAFPSSEVLLPCPALPGSCLPLQCACRSRRLPPPHLDTSVQQMMWDAPGAVTWKYHLWLPANQPWCHWNRESFAVLPSESWICCSKCDSSVQEN